MRRNEVRGNSWGPEVATCIYLSHTVHKHTVCSFVQEVFTLPLPDSGEWWQMSSHLTSTGSWICHYTYIAKKSLQERLLFSLVISTGNGQLPGDQYLVNSYGQSFWRKMAPTVSCSSKSIVTKMIQVVPSSPQPL